MKSLYKLLPVLVLAPTVAFAAGPKTYQVTGPVVEVNDNVIVVQKGKEKWEISRDASTKIAGDVKKGEKVTVEYRMTATSIAAKGGEKKGKK